MPGEDFPALAEPDPKAATLELELDSLSKLIARTHFSISTDETRAALNSALFEWDGDRVRMVTTDGHRLSKMEAARPGPAGHRNHAHPVQSNRRAPQARRRGTRRGRQRGQKRKKVIITQSGPNAFFSSAGPASR